MKAAVATWGFVLGFLTGMWAIKLMDAHLERVASERATEAELQQIIDEEM